MVGQPPASFTDNFQQGAASGRPIPTGSAWSRNSGTGTRAAATRAAPGTPLTFQGKKTPQYALTMYLGSASEGWTNYRARVRFNVRDGVKAGLWPRGTYRDQGWPGQWFTGYYCMVRVGATEATRCS